MDGQLRCWLVRSLTNQLDLAFIKEVTEKLVCLVVSQSNFFAYVLFYLKLVWRNHSFMHVSLSLISLWSYYQMNCSKKWIDKNQAHAKWLAESFMTVHIDHLHSCFEIVIFIDLTRWDWQCGFCWICIAYTYIVLYKHAKLQGWGKKYSRCFITIQFNT